MQIRGGDKLELALSKIAKNVERAAEVQIGFLPDAKYPDGTLVALVAAVQEFGSSKRGIPPRPFFRGMINAKSGEWPKAVAELLPANGYDAAKTLDQTGAAIAGQLQESIITFSGAPLAQSTIDRKGFDKQLVDTGVMLKSVSHIVVKK